MYSATRQVGRTYFIVVVILFVGCLLFLSPVLLSGFFSLVYTRTGSQSVYFITITVSWIAENTVLWMWTWFCSIFLVIFSLKLSDLVLFLPLILHIVYCWHDFFLLRAFVCVWAGRLCTCVRIDAVCVVSLYQRPRRYVVNIQAIPATQELIAWFRICLVNKQLTGKGWQG